MNRSMVLASRRRIGGASAVEFAVTSIFWVALIFGVIEFGRVMYMIVTSFEAARVAARYAAVCSVTPAQTKARARALLPILTDANINVVYPAAICSVTASTPSCPPITVTISNVSFNTLIPLAPLTFTLPTAQTSIVPETRRGTGAVTDC